MRLTLIFGFFATVASIAAEPDSLRGLGLTANTPTVEVSPRLPGRVNISLPSLTYAMSVTVDCEANWQPDSVSIGVADSRASFNAEQLRASRELTLELRIPSEQIPPLHVEHFCIIGDRDESDTTNTDKITISGVLSAQASLRCATESAKSITYLTKPLDVVLECAVPKPSQN
jgi:hypothetical protein